MKNSGSFYIKLMSTIADFSHQVEQKLNKPKVATNSPKVLSYQTLDERLNM